jgi:hypothetical protein
VFARAVHNRCRRADPVNHWTAARSLSYDECMAPPAPKHPPELRTPHPDNEANVRDALRAAERRELLSTAASDAFLRWLEGNGDESWRAEFE